MLIVEVYMCKYCKNRKDIMVYPSPLDAESQPDTAILMDKGLVLMKRHRAYGYIEINYCPICGEKLSE